jgi:hypothetical protein
MVPHFATWQAPGPRRLSCCRVGRLSCCRVGRLSCCRVGPRPHPPTPHPPHPAPPGSLVAPGGSGRLGETGFGRGGIVRCLLGQLVGDQMTWVRLLTLLSACFVVLAGVGCTGETFELLPPPADQASGGVQGGNGGFAGGIGGFGGFGGGGRGGQFGIGGERPNADCPGGVRECRPCASSFECNLDEVCDPTRHYCALTCSSNEECPFERQHICDTSTRACVQCRLPSDCGRFGWDCDRGACKLLPCTESGTCPDQFPVCDHGACRICYDDPDCSPGMKCFMGRCGPSP